MNQTSAVKAGSLQSIHFGLECQDRVAKHSNR